MFDGNKGPTCFHCIEQADKQVTAISTKYFATGLTFYFLHSQEWGFNHMFPMFPLSFLDLIKMMKSLKYLDSSYFNAGSCKTFWFNNQQCWSNTPFPFFAFTCMYLSTFVYNKTRNGNPIGSQFVRLSTCLINCLGNAILRVNVLPNITGRAIDSRSTWCQVTALLKNSLTAILEMIKFVKGLGKANVVLHDACHSVQ